MAARREGSRRHTRPGGAAQTDATWLEAAVRVPVEAADRLGTLLVEAGSHGVVTGVRELARGPRRRRYETVRGFFPAREPVRARLAVRAALSRARDPALARAPVAWRELDARLWEMDWREHFQPVIAGRTLVVVPPWDRARFGDRRRIIIHPGMAFGTGQHATTLACLETIERLATPPPASALDVGTGTGVLAIALAKLGVRRVLALDVDPQAIAAARANVRRNGVAARVRVSNRPLARASRRHHPLVVANLYVDVLVAVEPTLAEIVAPGGVLVTSGILRAQQGRLLRAYATPRWHRRSATRRGPWVTSVFDRER